MPRHAGGVSLNNYRIFETEEFLKKFEKLDGSDKAFVKNKLSSYVYPQLRVEPHFGKNVKKLKGYVPDTWRYRVGKFRIFYTIEPDDGVIFILTIDHRKDAYRWSSP
jgi:mRNA interferase RelE/StbE